ncbi:DUF5690 family protein [Siphonobacter curvatus]|uniref:MFS transporter n=1 Tax=Siphonobacter curvatus TaxID=2094562 RepID=A0A2S7IGS0_9BACT|nr:DUF5690 family protein [Siphonobacter curvatus]PQA54561.1 hypothetical protein C5O19_22715 [Siphonobacter curvatus]
MTTLSRKRVTPSWLVSLVAGLAAFGTYSCMYAFRKAFTAGTYSTLQLGPLDYKVWLILAQMLGYTLSKFYGIRFLAQRRPQQRIPTLIALLSMAGLALLGFALCPVPYNIVFLFLNGLPLGMIWGLVFSFLEGRRHTELMGAVMAISLIFASGLVKTVGLLLIRWGGISEFWMPFLTGLVFSVPLAGCLYVLSQIPAPSAEDKRLRTERRPMNRTQRRLFIRQFLPGIVLTVLVYTLLTVARDIRDNFEVEIWQRLGYGNQPGIYTQVDGPVALSVLLLLSLLILVRNNLKAFSLIHLMIIGACLLMGFATLAYNAGQLSGLHWMALSGLGLYLAYVPYNAIFFERMLATFREKGNVAFVMSLADSFGYLGSVGVLCLKEFSQEGLSWGQFYNQILLFVALSGAVLALASLYYFRKKHSIPSVSYPALVHD